MALAAGPLEQIDVHVRRILAHRARGKSNRADGTRNGPFRARVHLAGSPGGNGKLAAQVWPPLQVVPLLKRRGIERGQAIAAHALAVFQHQAQLGLERQVGPTKMRPSASGSS